MIKGNSYLMLKNSFKIAYCINATVNISFPLLVTLFAGPTDAHLSGGAVFSQSLCEVGEVGTDSKYKSGWWLPVNC